MAREYIKQQLLNSQQLVSKAVSLLDPFEGTFLWTVTYNAGTGVGAANTTAAYHETNGLQLATRSASAADGDWAKAVRNVCIPPSGLAVVNFRFSFPDVSDIEKLRLQYDLCASGTGYMFYVTLDPNTPTFKYLNSAANEVAILTPAVTCDDGTWHTLEMIIDIASECYHSARLDNASASLSAISGWATGPYTKSLSQVQLYVESKIAAQSCVYIDDFYFGEIRT